MGTQRAKVITGLEPVKEKKDKYADKKGHVKEKAKVKIAPTSVLKGASAPKARKAKTQPHSARYNKIKASFDRAKLYPITEAIDLVKKNATAKFIETIEVHIRIEKSKEGEAGIRGLITLPHSLGKKINVAILDEKMAEEILKTKKADFDIAIARPTDMAKLAKLAKILGPQGKMPNPKAGTISADPEKTKKEIEAGKTEYKTDAQGIVHQAIGKADWDSKKILDNFAALLKVLPQNKIISIVLTSTMGPGIKVNINTK